jgi:hypothetical protein
MIVKNNILPNILSIFMRISAITIYPFIFIRSDLSKEYEETVLNHEKIHLEQYKETFVLGFFPFYIYDFVYGLFKYKDFALAYYFIRMEQEAYENEHDLLYIKNRKKLAWKELEV